MKSTRKHPSITIFPLMDFDFDNPKISSKLQEWRQELDGVDTELTLEELKQWNGVNIIAHNKQHIGCVGLVDALHANEVQYLHGFVIDKKYRQQGFGRQALKQVIKSAKASGYNYLTLGVEKRNHVALKLYLDFGFSPTAESHWINAPAHTIEQLPSCYSLIKRQRDLTDQWHRKLDHYYMEHHLDKTHVPGIHKPGFWWPPNQNYQQLTKVDDNGFILATTGLYVFEDRVLIDHPLSDHATDLGSLIETALGLYARQTNIFTDYRFKYNCVIHQFGTQPDCYCLALPCK